MNTTTYGIDGFGAYFKPCVDGREYRGKSELRTFNFTDSNNFYGKRGILTTSIDIYNYIYGTDTLDIAVYNELLKALDSYDIVKKAIYTHIPEGYKGEKEIGIKLLNDPEYYTLDFYWIKESIAYKFIENMEVK